jgi:diguanylate cyclase (GGDEF)-like protein/PAS domain S-box-containing protein
MNQTELAASAGTAGRDDSYRALSAFYQHLLELLFALTPLPAIAYVALFQDPALRIEDHAFHEVAIAAAIIMAALVTATTRRCYLFSGERFLYWLTVGFFGFTVTYVWHGVFTRLAHDHMALFLLYGPVSRLIMAACLVAAALSITAPQDHSDVRRRRCVPWLPVFLAIDVGIAVIAESPLAQGPYLRVGLESAALALSVLAVLLLWRRARSPLITLSVLGTMMFAESSLSFLMAWPWNHQWWLAHSIFAGGFMVLSYGVVRAYLTTRSFSGFRAEEELLASLTESDDRLREALTRLRQNNENLEAQVAERSGELAAIFDTVLDGIMTSDEFGVIRAVNPAACKIFGYSAAEMVGHNVAMLVPDGETSHHRHMARYRDGGERHIIGVAGREVTGRRKDGSSFPLSLAIAETRQGGRRLLVGVLRDLTTEKAMEQQLRVAAVAFDARDGMVVTDPQGRILRVNRTFTDVTGYDADEAVGKTPALLRSDRHGPEFYRKMWEAIMREGHWQGEIWNRRKDGGIYPEWLSISAIADGSGQTSHYLGVFSDISEPREAQRRIIDLAFYDPLTGLPNRRLLLDRLNQALAATRRSRVLGALMLLDLDRFKTINDTRGHNIGDELLVQIGQRLLRALRQSDTAARLGGDEFVVLIEGLDSRDLVAATAAEISADKLRAALAEPYVIDGGIYHFSASIGVTLFSGNEDSEMLLRQADMALYQAKDAGRDAVRFYNPDMQAMLDARAALEAGLRRAMQEDEFSLHYQPQVDLGGRLIGAEALLRWHPPDGDPVSPADFIPVAEDSGLILGIGQWTLQQACRQLAQWSAHPDLDELRMSVNISARQFRQPNFVEQLEAVIAATGIDPARLLLELTESSVIEDIDKAVAIMETVKRIGIGFSMDDFGTGYSSLAQLKRLPLDELKIDRQFVRDLPHDGDDCAIAQAIVALGASLRLQVVAEGVETEGQRDYLRSIGCGTYQGYLFGRPMPAHEFAAAFAG